ncbi:long-chain fatty acid--CoA ligase [Mycobacteroides saopaulense]|uniref:Long-chain fatty acid--CoA ligase n=1 Tax=Mycobacteroides saopaulense TaxID=1578165 RepID=A0A1X0JAF8_9MYCO|nr:long-chain fatty acid--CoA ligase [Mycobacteroides saopaulense]
MQDPRRADRARGESTVTTNPVIERLRAGAGIAYRGLTSAPIGPDGTSLLDELRTVPWADVHLTGLRIAGALQAAGVRPGDAVAVLAGAPGEIAPLVQGIWLSGASVTMLHQPTHRSDMHVWVEDTGRALAAVGSSTVVVGDPFMAAVGQFGSVATRVLELPALLNGPPGEVVETDQDAIAFLQLTSGSTGTPKAVSISYRNIEANLRAMVSASGADPETDVVVSWLPLFHDMGMMGYLIVPMCRGMNTVSVTPMDFLGDPLLWARLISTYRGSMTAGPNFAYSLLARRLSKAPDGAYDLSSLQFALSGAEAIDVATLERFAAQGARFGMRAEAIVPAYGMAEATLAVSFVRRGEGFRVCPPHPDLVAAEGAEVSARVPLGLPLPGCEVRVVNDDREVLPANAIGELEIRGDNVTAGYRTASGFEPMLDAQGWLSTGDIGYLMQDGQPVICGRKKDILIISGRNVHPEDIERSVVGVAGVRSGGIAAVRLSTAAAGEGFAMVAESALHANTAESARIRAEVADRVYRTLGVSPRDVHVVPAGWIPKTSSGKLRRRATTERLAKCSVRR